MFEKIWSRHVVAEGPGGHVLLYIDRHLLHEGSTSAFARLAKHGRRVRRPDLTFATADHYVLTSRSEEHTSELQSLAYLVCRLLLEKKKKQRNNIIHYSHDHV